MSPALFLHFIRLQFKARMEYRGAYLLGILGQMIGYCGYLLVIWLFLSRFKSIEGWNWPEIAFVYSLNLLTYAIGASFTLCQMDLENNINGDFDKYLIKPLQPLMFYTANNYNVGYVPHFILSACILIWSIFQLSIEWTAIKLIYLCLVIISVSFLQAAFMIMLGSLSFTLVRIGFLFSLYFKIRDFISYPISIYGTLVQVILTIVIPLAFINYFPGLFLLSKVDGFWPSWFGLASLFVGPLFIWISFKAWMFGVSKYQSGGG